MPSSTVWRRPADGVNPRGVSPDPLSAEFIEKLSPEPFPPSPVLHTLRHRRPTRRNDSSLQGLGLLHSGILDESVSSAQPDHLYFDQNGGAHVGSSAASAGGEQEPYQYRTSQDWTSRQSRYYQDTRRARNKGHTRSGSTIDDLASAAIATSPTFNEDSPSPYDFQGSPVRYRSTRPATSHLGAHISQDSSYEIPPAKRIKSEILPATEWSPRASQPATGYLPSVESLNEEAALLLGLRTEVNFKTHISPPTPMHARIHYSPEADPINLQVPSTPPVQPIQEKEQPHNVQDTHTGVADVVQSVGQIKAPRLTTTTTDFSTTCLESLRQTEAGAEDLLSIGAANVTRDLATGQVKTDNNTQSKKIRRVKPQVQAEVCPECKRLQQETDGDEEATISWICCNGCERWFHAMCAGFKTKAEARSVDKFVCKDCEPNHGKTTFVRKSSRARTAIDYAGLNQGLIKSSVDTSMHHYVQPIKDGKITFLPDDFARIRPEILTAEFMESFEGMKRPFVVPACWNPRFGQPQPIETSAASERIAEDLCVDSHGNTVLSKPNDVDGVCSDEEEFEMVIDCEQDLLDMVMPRDLTVRKVAELYGPEEPVPVIDVKTQETKGAYTLSQWADYYELPGDKPIRNVISLEVSESRLGRLIRRPKVVRDLDLEDCVWDEELRIANKKRPVQFYCLMSVADSYTDFHIDFGGSSVYYHILKGTKTFFFIPPEDRYLKKYEEWCNSDTQNDTFLGDLCNNNCTRVDLHEGDTAFIPAGWIHAVWTPEDSLVIGGNFLTRLDYDLQLKVANIEKVTKVSPKFRYPFFQKVMWYALIKYLEDDPVPDDVIQEFQDDADFEFLRANQVWLELGALSNDAEPGTADFHARYYPKAEITGLPALRDYLYRTARVYADLPVPDINKKQIDAVKASVPKGHGDPLTLIKMFAIWCAWKIGSVPVPEWVHTDAGGLSEFEKKEKTKKPEIFRLPGERTSLRRANQATARDSPDPLFVTPNKAVGTGSEVDSDSGKKSRSGAKGSGLRVACEACRKRRIRCRHKEGEVSPSGGESTRQRSQSVVSNDTAAPTASLSNLPRHAKVESPDSFLHESNLTSDLAQAALATLDSHQIDLNQTLTNGTMPFSGKKSRSKACEECRKSKRRCVHDEHGRVDPAKAAEPSKPRGSASGKRSARPSDEGIQPKRSKLEFESDGMLAGPHRENIDALIDPALTNGEFVLPTTDDTEMAFMSTSETAANPLHVEMSNGTAEDLMDVDIQQLSVARPADSTPMAVESLEPVQSRSTSVKPEPEYDLNTDGLHNANQAALDHVSIASSELGSVGGQQEPLQSSGDLQLDKISPPSRHSSRQPKQVERYTPEGHRSPTKAHPRSSREERRASSAVSGQTIFTTAKSRRSSSNTSGTTHQIGATVIKRTESHEAAVRPGSRDSTAESDVDADEKFARELQAAENGLRRRTSLRA